MAPTPPTGHRAWSREPLRVLTGTGRRGAPVHECWLRAGQGAAPRRARWAAGRVGSGPPGGVSPLWGARCSTWEHFWYKSLVDRCSDCSGWSLARWSTRRSSQIRSQVERTGRGRGRGAPVLPLGRCVLPLGCCVLPGNTFGTSPSWIIAQTAADRRFGVGPRGVHRRFVPRWNGLGGAGAGRRTGRGRPALAAIPGHVVDRWEPRRAPEPWSPGLRR